MSQTTQHNAIWQLESTHPDLVDSLRNALREVVDPEIGLNIVELGLIRDVMIEDNNAIVTMILTTPFCPYGPALLEMARSKAESALKIPTTIEMGMEMWDLSYMDEGAAAEWGIF